MQCRIWLKRTITHCGMHSHSSVVRGGEMSYVVSTTRDECVELHRTGKKVYSDGTTIDGIKQNASTTHSTLIAGKLNNNGDCEGTTYSDPYGVWDKVVVQGYLTITLTDYTATVDLEKDRLMLRSGTVCRMSFGRCRDSDEAYTFWNTLPVDSCKFDRYDILFDGFAYKLYEGEGRYNQTIYTVTSKDVTFAFMKTGVEHLCTIPLVRTEHPKLFILEKMGSESPIKRKPLMSANIDLFAYVNSKFVYVERHFRSQLKDLYRDILRQRCELEIKVLKNTLALATQAPDEFAYHLMKGPGYMALIAGEVVHIIKCLAVEVTVRQIKECYQQLPVMKGNESYFLSPRTHILIHTGTQVDCNLVVPIMYRLNGKWYEFIPMPVQTMRPATIQPQTRSTWKYFSPGNLASSGIYTQGDLNRLREHIMFPAEKPAVLNTIVRAISGQPSDRQGMVLSNLFDEEALKRISADTWNRLWTSFMSFGTASAGIIGTVFIIRMIKLLVDTVIHGYALHKVYGWSVHLFGAIWSSITHLLISLGKEDKKRSTVEISAPLESENSISESDVRITPQQAYFTFHKNAHNISTV